MSTSASHCISLNIQIVQLSNALSHTQLKSTSHTIIVSNVHVSKTHNYFICPRHHVVQYTNLHSRSNARGILLVTPSINV